MYHGLIKDTGRQNKYFIDAKYFEEDLKYLNENGYNTIFLSELIRYFENGDELPENPVILTFDDGYYNNYVYAYPLLKKYNCKAVISPIGYAADEALDEKYRSVDYSQCKWSELKEMAESGYAEIQNHTYNLHSLSDGRSGAQNKKDEDIESYREMLTEDLQKFNTRMYEETGKYPNSMVFPFGARSQETIKTVKEMKFKAALDCEEKLNFLETSEDLYYIHRFLRPNNLSSKSFFENTVDIGSTKQN